MILIIICFFLGFYAYYDEVVRSHKRDELDKGILEADSKISAISESYGKTSQRLSKDIQGQLDYQVRDVNRVLSRKDKELQNKAQEIYHRDLEIYNTRLRQEQLENELDSVTAQLDDERMRKQNVE